MHVSCHCAPFWMTQAGVFGRTCALSENVLGQAEMPNEEERTEHSIFKRHCMRVHAYPPKNLVEPFTSPRVVLPRVTVDQRPAIDHNENRGVGERGPCGTGNAKTPDVRASALLCFWGVDTHLRSGAWGQSQVERPVRVSSIALRPLAKGWGQAPDPRAPWPQATNPRRGSGA